MSSEVLASTVLSVRGLTKSFGGLVATDRVDLDVSLHEVRGIIGPNGAGKTTLIAQISGLLLPDAGDIVFEGVNVTGRGAAKRAQMGLVRTFQITSIFPAFTVRENILLAVQAQAGHCFRFWEPAHQNDRLSSGVDTILERFDLSDRENVSASDLAHGEKRILEIAIAIARKPRFLLLDEPTAGMGTREAEATKKLLATLRGEYTIVLIEHDMDAVFRLCDRISVMARGSIIATGTPAEIRENTIVQEAYLGDEAFLC